MAHLVSVETSLNLTITTISSLGWCRLKRPLLSDSFVNSSLGVFVAVLIYNVNFLSESESESEPENFTDCLLFMLRLHIHRDKNNINIKSK